jgi:serine/threonine-protein kinase ULK/ATG1
LRRSGTTGGINPSSGNALAKLPTLSSPTLFAEANNNPLIGTRAFTLPDMQHGGNNNAGNNNANGFSLLHNECSDHPITFYAPELPAETLLDVRGNINVLLSF